MNHPDPQTIDEYIELFPAEVQEILRNIRKVVREAAPDAEEAIKYRMPTFVLNGNLVHFAAFEHHIGFYPTPSGIDRYRSELQKYHHAKGSVQFPLQTGIPYDLIRRIVQFRVAESRIQGPAATKKSAAGRRTSPAKKAKRR